MYKYIYLSIDPGTNNLGTTINGITLDDQWHVLHTCTTDISLLIKHTCSPDLLIIHGERFFKTKACADVISKFAKDWCVSSIVSESPYMGKFAQAFAALTECLYSMRLASFEHSQVSPLYLIDPSTIKKSVGVSGKSGDKELMRAAMKRLAGHMVNIDYLDEHSIDSMAAGYSWYWSVWMGNKI